MQQYAIDKLEEVTSNSEEQAEVNIGDKDMEATNTQAVSAVFQGPDVLALLRYRASGNPRESTTSSY